MTLLFIEGFDHTAHIDHILSKWTSHGISDWWDTGRFGTGYSKGFSWSNQWLSKTFSWSKSEIITGFAFKTTNNGTPNIYQVSWYLNTTQMVSMNLQTNSKFRFCRGNYNGTTLAETTNTFANNVWHYVEAKIKFANSGGYIICRVNGNEEINATGLDTNNGGASDAVNKINIAGPSTWNTYYDDMYICDLLGSYNNDFLGDVRVETLMPTGAGNYSQWTPSTGSNYENVDDTYPDDDSTYNDGDTINDKDSYQLANLVTTGGTIMGVQSNIIASKTDAGTVKYKPLLYINSSDYLGDEISPSVGYVDSMYIDEINPDDSLAWEIADINALEGGIQRTA